MCCVPPAGYLGEVVMEHALAGNRLDEFDEGTSAIGLSGQSFAGCDLAMIASTGFLLHLLTKVIISSDLNHETQLTIDIL